MKTFFTVFFAILAAAVVMFIGVSAKARLDQWYQTKRMCYVQINSEIETRKLRVDQINQEALALAQLAKDSRDVAEVERHSLSGLDVLINSRRRIIGVEQTLVAILQQKPFGLPLTADERKELDSARADIQSDAEKPK